MNAPLRDRYEVLQRALTVRTEEVAWTRYRIGRLIADVKATEGLYGQGAITELAAALGFSEPTLYRFALVAETWSERQLKALLARKTPHGEPLSFSHLVQLAQVADETLRREMLASAMNHGTSVRQLSKQIAEHQRGGPLRRAAGTSEAILREVAATTDAVQRKIESSERLLSRLEKISISSNVPLEPLIAETIAKHRTILVASARFLEKLERARKQLATGGRARAPKSPSVATMTRTATRTRRVSARGAA
ncbi:hypothetical protein LVJ94_17400 [Pendulispora rubella]|uniref:Uncharacterized protein n=1 Tax=Pendulispora rubella TaxID=2741070 RepID=A0ABZ2LIK9_9BACT